MTVPNPWQAGQASVAMTVPSSDRTGRWIMPWPWQVWQVSGWVPGSQHEPSHRSQRTAVSSSIVCSPPKTASRRSIRAVTRASWPRRARLAGPPRPPWPAAFMKVSKMSAKPPKPPAPPKPPGKPAWPFSLPVVS